LKMFSYQASGNLVSIASIVGGIAAQEAMKAITHHMTPLRQFVYIDCLEALPGDWSPYDNEKLTANDCKMKNSRYDGQVAVFGQAFQDALAKHNFFIVGAVLVANIYTTFFYFCMQNRAKKAHSSQIALDKLFTRAFISQLSNVLLDVNY
uniref:ThiF domain-containing protein n=1 Tax=Gongylonema pulchrum TaxID=637853 RepID=A0A183DBS0_9BILA